MILSLSRFIYDFEAMTIRSFDRDKALLEAMTINMKIPEVREVGLFPYS